MRAVSMSRPTAQSVSEQSSQTESYPCCESSLRTIVASQSRDSGTCFSLTSGATSQATAADCHGI
eukprot:6202979-Pleurochrysis_carterae.AAC.2